MKRFFNMIRILFLFTVGINAQQFTSVAEPSNTKDTGPPIDTTDFFPMQNGNYWEYAASTFYGTEYFSRTVIGDTLMPNGKTYKVVVEKYFYLPGYEYPYYFRKDSSYIYRYKGGGNTQCGNGEYKYYDFSSKDSTIWSMCTGDTINNSIGNARGIMKTYYDYMCYMFLQKDLETKLFNEVFVNSTDTIWGPGDGAYPTRIAKGFGMAWQLRYNDGQYYLQGAIIDGVKFGTIVTVKDNFIQLPKQIQLKQNYPNPFNPSTKISYQIPAKSFVTLKVYDLLGNEVAELVNEWKETGSYTVQFTTNGKQLASGMYFYTLSAGEFTDTKKFILLK